jgi:hypothetical protein
MAVIFGRPSLGLLLLDDALAVACLNVSVFRSDVLSYMSRIIADARQET